MGIPFQSVCLLLFFEFRVAKSTEDKKAKKIYKDHHSTRKWLEMLKCKGELNIWYMQIFSDTSIPVQYMAVYQEHSKREYSFTNQQFIRYSI